MKASKFIVEDPRPDTFQIPADWKPYEVYFSAANKSGREVKAIRYESIVLDHNGIVIGGSTGYDTDLSVQPDESHFFFVNKGRLPGFTSAGNYDDLKAVCNFRLMASKKYDLGTYDVPMSVSDVINQEIELDLESIVSPIHIRIYSAGEPDRNDIVTVFTECTVSIKDKSFFENIEFRVRVLEKSGKVADERISRQELLPDFRIFTKETSALKISKIKNAKINVSLDFYEDVVRDRIEIVSRRATPDD